MNVLEGSRDDRHTQARGLPKRSVPGRQKRVAQTERIAEEGARGFRKEVWFAALRVDVAVCAKEGIEGADLVPADEELF
jgi:hypothetical protein